jgi:uncharacterized protein YjbJ (UPF0337 family)
MEGRAMVNEFEGTARDIGGQTQDAPGGTTSDTETQLCGKANQAFCTAQKTFRAAMEGLSENVTNQPLTALLLAGAIGVAIGSFVKR